MAWKDNAIIHISKTIAKGSKFSDCWICHFKKLLSVHGARVTLIHFFVSVNNPKLGKPCVQAVCKKIVHEEKVKLPRWSTDPFTSLHGCHLSNLEPKIQMGITRRHSVFKTCFL